MTVTFIVVCVIIYSIIGFVFMRDYSLRCHAAGYFPFNGHVGKYIGCSLICGAFTTTILFIGSIMAFWSFGKEFWAYAKLEWQKSKNPINDIEDNENEKL